MCEPLLTPHNTAERGRYDKMSTVLTDENALEAGVGWYAEIHAMHLNLYVSPDGDSLPAALEALLAPSQRRFWTVEWICTDAAGWDFYLVERVQPQLQPW